MAENDSNAAICERELCTGCDAILATTRELWKVVLVETTDLRSREFEVGCGKGEKGRKSEDGGFHFDGLMVGGDVRWGSSIECQLSRGPCFWCKILA